VTVSEDQSQSGDQEDNRANQAAFAIHKTPQRKILLPEAMDKSDAEHVLKVCSTAVLASRFPLPRSTRWSII
jgi:hypothetical protein